MESHSRQKSVHYHKLILRTESQITEHGGWPADTCTEMDARIAGEPRGSPGANLMFPCVAASVIVVREPGRRTGCLYDVKRSRGGYAGILPFVEPDRPTSRRTGCASSHRGILLNWISRSRMEPQELCSAGTVPTSRAWAPSIPLPAYGKEGTMSEDTPQRAGPPRSVAEPSPKDSSRAIPLRRFVILIVVAALAWFTWHRTGGDALLTALVASLASTTLESRVGR